MGKFLCFDIEANGLKPSEIWCICATDLLTREKLSFGPDEIPHACCLLEEADMLVGHYIRGYDCPVIERLTDGLIQFDKSRLVDTLELSKKLTSNRKHSLKFWGNEFGLPKLESPNFYEYTPEMLVYCERDVEITVRLFDHLLESYVLRDRDKITILNESRMDDFIGKLMSS